VTFGWVAPTCTSAALLKQRQSRPASSKIARVGFEPLAKDLRDLFQCRVFADMQSPQLVLTPATPAEATARQAIEMTAEEV
jgi:hypothetical protein